jgi:hypothetical protein
MPGPLCHAIVIRAPTHRFKGPQACPCTRCPHRRGRRASERHEIAPGGSTFVAPHVSACSRRVVIARGAHSRTARRARTHARTHAHTHSQSRILNEPRKGQPCTHVIPPRPKSRLLALAEIASCIESTARRRPCGFDTVTRDDLPRQPESAPHQESVSRETGQPAASCRHSSYWASANQSHWRQEKKG